MSKSKSFDIYSALPEGTALPVAALIAGAAAFGWGLLFRERSKTTKLAKELQQKSNKLPSKHHPR